jgi:hypothetical protein
MNEQFTKINSKWIHELSFIIKEVNINGAVPVPPIGSVNVEIQGRQRI